MADSYLELAKKVISVHGKPLSAQHILSEANRFEMLPEHLHGQTMQKTLQARIAEDIFFHRETSDFFRTSLGKYFLRSLLKRSEIPEQHLTEFKPAKQRKRPDPQSRVLFTRIPSNLTNSGFLSSSSARSIIEENNDYHYLDIAPQSLVSIATFTFLSKRNRFLSFVVGKHSHFRDQIGKRTIGFRRYVDEYDIDLFCDEQFGINMSASREVLYQLVGVEKLDDRAVQQNLVFLGGYFEKENSRLSLVLHLKLGGTLDFDISDLGRLEINDPAIVGRETLPLEKFDSLSKTILDGVY